MPLCSAPWCLQILGLSATWIAHWYADSLISRDRTFYRATKAVKKALKSLEISVRSDDPYIERKQLLSRMKKCQKYDQY